ncbi:Na+/H+ antiporter NhaC family protein [Halalkalibacter hemicellulosilyticus]|uniref:NhaC, Na+/H+ antiporter n=1 Tax=Halalkalibacter hemicellulosilyticusJCM 9152 TaxID=1236971 RepID=W4QK92_9BACI|nr:Na+/H+ antiporter NhaC family protein [Halalkalibacter hemicellulosilyticus]GAE32530.1 NhaC, Na+/H+ antiporter [Halalkalibacter hemicellulosilyticusJCM 9152]
MESSWFAIVPFLFVIPIAIYTKQVLPGLFVGLLVGSYLIEPTLLGGVQAMFIYVVQALIDPNNIKIIVFLYSFSGLVGMVKVTGGIRGFVEKAAERIHTRKQALVLTYVSTIGTFSAPTFRFVTIAPIMRALLKRVKMTTAELGFIIETTATPVIVLIPVATAFVGYMVSVIQMATENEGLEIDSYSLFIQSIPFNFFSIVMIGLGIYLSFFHHAKKKSTAPLEIAEQEEDDDWHECHPVVSTELPIKPWNLVVPLVLVIILTLFLTWWDGYERGVGPLEAFIRANVLDAMVVALLLTTMVTMLFYLLQKFKLSDLIESFVFGGNELMSVIILLSVVWGLSSVTDDLGFSSFVTAHTSWIPPLFIAPLVFLFGAAVSYFIGSAWGTWGILMPLGMALAIAGDVAFPLVVGAVFASGAFGAFASPLSDDTNTIAKILGLTVIDYAKYKLKPALIAAAITALLYTVVTFVV